MSSLSNKKNTTNTIDNPYHPIFQCSLKPCVEYFKRGIKKHCIISNTNIAIKKLVTCMNCGNSWVVCTACVKAFKEKRYSSSSHFSTIHKAVTNTISQHESTAKKTSQHSVNHIDMMTLFDNDDDQSITSLVSTTTNNQMSNLQQLENAEMTIEHKDMFMSNMEQFGKGYQQLVSKAVVKVAHIDTSYNETKYHLDVATFCQTLDQGQRNHFGRIMNQTMDPNTFKATKPPKSLQDINAFYIKGKTSIFNAIPTPQILTSTDHAYVTITSVIEYFLAYGYDADYMKHTDNLANKKGISACNQAVQIRQEVAKTFYEEVPLIFYVTFWSDDFEGAMLRKNKKSIWIKTITICPPSNQTTSTKYTYVLAIGRKGSNHDEINVLHNDELYKLQQCTYRYYGVPKYKRMVPIIVKTIAILSDRPERSSVTYILQHNGITTRRWRYAAYINLQKLPSCEYCFFQRLNSMTSYVYTKCRHCCDWNYQATNNHLCQPLPTDYPNHQHKNSPRPPVHRGTKSTTTIKPIQQTNELLITASQFCAYNYWHNVWSKKMLMHI